MSGEAGSMQQVTATPRHLRAMLLACNVDAIGVVRSAGRAVPRPGRRWSPLCEMQVRSSSASRRLFNYRRDDY